MTFERAWVLIFLLLPLGWMVYEMRRTRRTLALLLKIGRASCRERV